MQRSWLYALQATAFSALERSEDEGRAARAGLAIAPVSLGSAHVDVLFPGATARQQPMRLRRCHIAALLMLWCAGAFAMWNHSRSRVSLAKTATELARAKAETLAKVSNEIRRPIRSRSQ